MKEEGGWGEKEDDERRKEKRKEKRENREERNEEGRKKMKSGSVSQGPLFVFKR